MSTDQVQNAEVTAPVEGVVKVGLGQLQNPTPTWLKYIVRALIYITGLWATMGLGDYLKDFGVSDPTAIKVGRIMMVITALLSGVARFVGVEQKDDSAADPYQTKSGSQP